MRNLTRLALAISLAACGDPPPNTLPPPACVEDPELPECEPPPGVCLDDLDCASLNSADGCIQGFCLGATGCDTVNNCEDLGSAELVIFMNDNGSFFVGAELDLGQAMDDYLDEEQAFAQIPAGTCAEIDRTNSSGTSDRQSMGTIEVLRGDTVLVTLQPGDEGRYEQIVDPGIFNLGDTLALRTSGSPVLAATTFANGFLPVLTAFPNITGTFDANNVLQLTSTMTFDDVVVDELIIGFTFLEGQNVIELQCRGDIASRTLTMATELFDRLPASGSMFYRAFNQRFRALGTTDGQTRYMRSLIQAGGNHQYQK